MPTLGTMVDVLKEFGTAPSDLLARTYARWTPIDNFGDALNPWLIERISGSVPANISVSRPLKLAQEISRKPDFVMIGSTLQWCGRHSVIWGAGFMSADSQLRYHPREVRAVRGPLSRARLLAQGVSCPEVYGDPALLVPRFLTPSPEKKYALGLVPHYVDKANEFVRKARSNRDVLVIDVQRHPEAVIRDITSCERVASSSLHGIIISDAYRIPSLWIKCSDGVRGGGFKFNDYFQSTGDDKREVMNVTGTTGVDDLVSRTRLHELDIDLELLWDACPFISSSNAFSTWCRTPISEE
jgi:pyruvyltransferase